VNWSQCSGGVQMMLWIRLLCNDLARCIVMPQRPNCITGVKMQPGTGFNLEFELK